MTDHDLEEKVRLFCGVAKVNDSVLTLSELRELLSENRSEMELESAIRSNPSLDSDYEVSGGYIVERRGIPAAEQVEKAGRERAKSNLRHGLGLSQLLTTAHVRMMGVSGSTSYGSASRSQDVDFFSVTEGNRMWVFLTRALVVSRVLRLAKRGGPDVCLSCTVDSDYAERFFSTRNGALFARDALSMRVLSGGEYYGHLLLRGSWMSGIYPRLYAATVGSESRTVVEESSASAWELVLNKLLYATVGTYIRVKSFLHNRRFLGQGKSDSVFELLIGEDHCIYESARYTKMRSMYGAMEGR